jgi:hypothetical protein
VRGQVKVREERDGSRRDIRWEGIRVVSAVVGHDVRLSRLSLRRGPPCANRVYLLPCRAECFPERVPLAVADYARIRPRNGVRTCSRAKVGRW